MKAKFNKPSTKMVRLPLWVSDLIEQEGQNNTQRYAELLTKGLLYEEKEKEQKERNAVHGLLSQSYHNNRIVVST